MKNKRLFKTNLMISCILLAGFALTALLSYQANYRATINSIEQVSSLTAESIYYQMTAIFTKPVNISLTMANDSLLIEHLKKEPEEPEDENYIETTKKYLDSYRDKYKFDSVFLVSSNTGRYYNFNGLDRVLTEGDEENTWYYDLLKSKEEYQLNVDNDEVQGRNNTITVFVNCKIKDADQKVIGIVGVGISVDSLMNILEGYKEKCGVTASLINENGNIEISTTHTGYAKTDWFVWNRLEKEREKILGWKEDTQNLELWTAYEGNAGAQNYIVTRYIPELSWHLIIERNTGEFLTQIQQQIYRTIWILIAVIISILVIITFIIQNFNRQITDLLEEKQAFFKKATEQLYDNIYEVNITHNQLAGKQTEEYFAKSGAIGLPYDKSLKAITDLRVKEEFREGYFETFKPENVKRRYEEGLNHLYYELMVTEDGTDYRWIRTDAYIFYSEEDNSLHMFVYRKDIDREKKQEHQALTDEMTGFYNKKAAERRIDERLQEEHGKNYALFLFDIDNFKSANDLFGHAFGDTCICIFTSIIREYFRKEDILGRIGGDEFVVFASGIDKEEAEKRAAEISKALCTVCRENNAEWRMSASVGVALGTENIQNFRMLYENADAALYRTKRSGRNGFTIFEKE